LIFVIVNIIDYNKLFKKTYPEKQVETLGTHSNVYRIGFDLTVKTLSRDSMLSLNDIYKNYSERLYL